MINTLPRVSYKEVMKELENSNTLNQKVFAKGVTGFKEKANTLRNYGFENSITTRMYQDVSNSTGIIADYQQRYPHVKFLLDSQLETVYEKFNLYERPTRFYMGVIPEPNVRQIANFKFAIRDLRGIDINAIIDRLIGSVTHIPHRAGTIIQDVVTWEEFLLTIQSIGSPKWYIEKYLAIAAVKEMFHEDAFGPQYGTGRIPNKAELIAKSQVDTDPILILKVNGGNLIITAWGEEANDELVLNPRMN